jgi:ribulose kinase
MHNNDTDLGWNAHRTAVVFGNFIFGIVAIYLGAVKSDFGLAVSGGICVGASLREIIPEHPAFPDNEPEEEEEDEEDDEQGDEDETKDNTSTKNVKE